MENTEQRLTFRPAQGGIFRGFSPGCFMCGGDGGEYNCFTAYAPEAFMVVVWLSRGACLRDGGRIVVGGCDRHKQNLERLRAETMRSGAISSAIITMAQKEVVC